MPSTLGMDWQVIRQLEIRVLDVVMQEGVRKEEYNRKCLPTKSLMNEITLIEKSLRNTYNITVPELDENNC